MATEVHGAETGGLVFHPMDQFIVGRCSATGRLACSP